MKRIFLALLAALWATLAVAQVGPPNQIQCNAAASANVASATTTSLVAGVAGKSIFICGWHVTSTQSTSTTFAFEYGTQGGPCTTPTVLTPTFSVTSTAPSSDHIDFATLQVPQGAQLCVVTTGATVGDAILVWFGQY